MYVSLNYFLTYLLSYLVPYLTILKFVTWISCHAAGLQDSDRGVITLGMFEEKIQTPAATRPQRQTERIGLTTITT